MWKDKNKYFFCIFVANKENNIKITEKMKQFGILMMMGLLMAMPATLKGQEGDDELLTIETMKVIQNGSDCYRVAFELDFPEGQPELERHAVKFLFNDSMSQTLIEGVNTYLHSLGTEELEEAPATLKEDIFFLMKQTSFNKGKYQCYHLSQQKRVTEQGKKQMHLKRGYCIYDETRQRVLTIDDVFRPEYAAILRKDANLSNTDLFIENDELYTCSRVNGQLLTSKVDEMGLKALTDDYLKLRDDKVIDVGVLSLRPNKTNAIDGIEQMPEFPGGTDALEKWVSEQIKYPSIAEANGIQGRVVCSFIVERDGSITNVRMIRSLDPSLDREAIRLLMKMPKWNPGKRDGVAFRARFTVPVIFQLGSRKKMGIF